VSKGPILTVPACEEGRGGGHITRCMKLVHELQTLGREAQLFLLPGTNAETLLSSTDFNKKWLIDEADLQSKSWECIILDRFQTPPEELTRWAALAPVIGIDEGGVYRNRFDFLIDILSGNREKRLSLLTAHCSLLTTPTPNIADPSLLPLQEKKPWKDSVSGAPLKILITFGQEDAAGLGPAVAEALAEKLQNAKKAEIDITLLQGKMSSPVPHSPLPTPHSLKITQSIPNLSHHLHEYDLVITHYGLTSFEALYAGVPVILVSPGKYHAKLAKAAGFFSSKTKKSGAAKLARLLFKNGNINYTFLAGLKTRCAALAARHNLAHPPRQSLSGLMNSFAPEINRNCPACGGDCGDIPALARFPERTYRRCDRCGIIFMDRLNPPPIEYDKEYFFESYQKQYGKTYIEDFPNLIATAKQRLTVIKSILPADNGNAPDLLDIGCAYGPFLVAAREEGFSPQGIDPAEDAVRYVTQTLNIPAMQGFFPLPLFTFHFSFFTCITLWYVIEHFRDCVPVFAEIRKLLKPGGVLAFSTPSSSGISGRSSLRRFLENSPADHRTIWSPASCKKALKTAGFTVKKIVICGHHPERFPLFGKLAKSKRSPLYGLLSAVSRVFGLGDTFEVYAIRDN
jgi:spore coat polysaccharide biosynthesis predicted glycosyltransferase SpsG/2-polyprenyl-3-methyl-5-hydroxy-6-metoxy-1,4-benzoquinol methylase